MVTTKILVAAASRPVKSFSEIRDKYKAAGSHADGHRDWLSTKYKIVYNWQFNFNLGLYNFLVTATTKVNTEYKFILIT